MTMTLGAQLERDRLAWRAARLDRVVSELRAQARSYGDRLAVPRPLCHSLADFQRELDHIRERLAAPAALDTRGRSNHMATVLWSNAADRAGDLRSAADPRRAL